MVLEVQPKDDRGYFMLPQAPEGAGYYVYGTPGQGGGQYAHPFMMTMLLFVETQWVAMDSRKFGIGNISLAGGGAYEPHRSHKKGLEVDVRPVRKDGKRTAVSWQSTDQYDQAATANLIALFRAYPGVGKVYFNDPDLRHLSLPQSNHDNHFHVELKA
jgi:penicillin-insensitive murein endopeptidase